jgi:hypothetical protein
VNKKEEKKMTLINKEMKPTNEFEGKKTNRKPVMWICIGIFQIRIRIRLFILMSIQIRMRIRNSDVDNNGNLPWRIPYPQEQRRSSLKGAPGCGSAFQG